MKTDSEGNIIHSRAQETQFELLEMQNWNDFNGEAVAESLRDNPHLWVSFVVKSDLGMQLRELPGVWHADTLYIRIPTHFTNDVVDGIVEQLRTLALGEWRADEFDRGRDVWNRENPIFQLANILPDTRRYGIDYVRVWWD